MNSAVPSGWRETTLGHVLQRSPSYGINAPALPRGFGRYPYLRITDIDEAGRVDIGTLPSVRDSASDAYILSDGDIVVARTGASVGKSHLFKDTGEPVVFAGFLIRLSADTNSILPGYLAQLMQTAQYWDWIRENSVRSGQPGVNGQQLKTIPLVLPPLSEQHAIAEALSDADGVIEGLERLIAKKRRIKQGAMQNLLTGKRRLPGFSGEWVEKRLGDLGVCLRGVSYDGSADRFEAETPESIMLLRANNVQNGKIVYSEVQHVRKERVKPEQQLKRGDILLCMANGSRALVGKAGVFSGEDNREYTFGAFMGCFRPAATASADGFVPFLFQSNEYRNQLNVILSGSAINNLAPSDILTFSFKIPLDHAEQQAITSVLEDLEAEIRALETRLAKARAIKAGMMEALLTGRIRLAGPLSQERATEAAE